MSVTVLVPAAGMGRRMGATVNKQYLALDGRPILAHTLALFDSHPQVDHLFVISPPAEIDYCRAEVVERYRFGKVRAVVPGGGERQDSVRNGLLACGAGPQDTVLVHDGVRPLFPPELIPVVVEAARRCGACVVGVPVKDTIKEVVEGRVRGTPDRERLWQAQTPQAFRFDLILKAHRKALEAGFRVTDDAALVERLGHPVVMVEGSYRNIKITTPEDLALVRALRAFSKGEEP
ncbi:MAG: 2-C-methyl-D-erythritol 4-phosphate cytidylyltransferase [Desulfuromonas sp.]|uniref:2-C-methyl-D-erythritol 4-phosphate cytidylyltransferase n=1 Tax=Desulfuromonas sp. TaxID=892 RepID=UPI000CC16831|nr:2-C-methyl-D-erythritol 4-phosphate cytidylyltransferase [Desulfuromonas sp.]PLX83244.1 MAG: 2-C-methyl-D-erythritol 4-phosphate cytidylyltransferase [Desulfuromonas sp.]